jgi:hypothetical protein
MPKRGRRKKALEDYKPPEKKPMYDGSLIYKAEDEMTDSVYFFDRENNEVHNCTRLVHSLTGNLDLKKEPELAPEVMKIIKEGKLRMHLLLNASSGREYAYNEIMDVMDFVRRKRGLVEAYGKERVMGYPALLYIHSDIRYAIKDTLFKWYLDWYNDAEEMIDYKSRDIARKSLKEIKKRVEKQTAYTRDLLLNKTDKKKHDEMKKSLYMSEGAKKTPPEFEFRGRQLMDLGVIHRVFTDTESLKKKFESNLSE